MIHKYLLNGYHIVLDTNSGAVHLFDELPFQMLDYLEDGVPENPPEEPPDPPKNPLLFPVFPVEDAGLGVEIVVAAERRSSCIIRCIR